MWLVLHAILRIAQPNSVAVLAAYNGITMSPLGLAALADAAQMIAQR